MSVSNNNKTRSSSGGEGDSQRRALFVFACLITIVGWQFPWGRTVLYPFTLFATFVHEMGHGLAALVVGANFDHLEINADGSGVAHWSGRVGSFSRAFIAAGGLVGPSIAGALVLVLSRSGQNRVLMGALGVLILGSTLFWVRSLVGFALLVPWGAVLLLVSVKKPRLSPFILQLLGAQLCLSIYRDVDYMFSEGALVDGVRLPSDTAAMADALWLPYWFWGGLVAVFSLAVLGLGFYHAFKGGRPVSGERPPESA